MAVHAHPDDEASGTGGVFARYAAEGIRTVLVTCTDGSCGDGPGGVKPGEPGHDRDEVAALRTGELRKACAELGVGTLEQLGYRDSGMMGWPTNDEPGAFWSMDVIEAARPLVVLMEKYRPQVVVTYDANGFYGHPDHIMAHRIALVAASVTGIPVKLYYTAIARSGLATFAAELRNAGIEPPGLSEREEGRIAQAAAAAEAAAVGESADADSAAAAAAAETAAADGEEGPAFGAQDLLITTSVDVNDFIAAKRRALAAHSSQADNIFFLQLTDELFARFFGTETFIRVIDRTDAEVPETDLFAGLRQGH